MAAKNWQAPLIPARIDASQFASTRWTVVNAAFPPRDNAERPFADSTVARDALAQLCRNYWYPLYAYVRRRGYSPSDAQDLTQDFFLHLLEQRESGRMEPDPNKGRFRSYLLASLLHFLEDHQDRQSSQRRGGGFTFVPFTEEALEARYRREENAGQGALSAETYYERKWAVALVETALSRTRAALLDAAEVSAAAAAERFEVFRPFLKGDDDPGAQTRAAVTLGISVGAFRAALRRLRKQYRAFLRWEITRTVNSPADVDSEIRHLCAVLARRSD